MVKRGSLNKVEKFFIEGNANLPIEDIATELDRSVNIVTKHLDTLSDTKAEKVEEAPPVQKAEDTQFQQAMGRHERNGQKVAAVMTRSASELADEKRPQRVASKKMQDAIHKPRG